jgi:hypothetical protein
MVTSVDIPLPASLIYDLSTGVRFIVDATRNEGYDQGNRLSQVVVPPDTEANRAA